MQNAGAKRLKLSVKIRRYEISSVMWQHIYPVLIGVFAMRGA
jgi:hypothetical protein